ncbi:replication initiation protein [Paracoccus binzhouensis]|uniref:replication initiation protein n=1 Tax=Paracoccus binzhouensis TaxID=2796149 RepID=UPI0018EEE489|nr:replication initiation protein [Paracoccus binzhouensis]
MGKTVQVAVDRAFDKTKTVLPAEVARGTYMQNPPGLAALKLMHVLIGQAGGRMGEDVEHRVRLSEVRGVEGLRHHDRASLAPLFAELQAAVLISDDTERKRLTIGGLLDIAEVDYRDEASGDLVISWYFSRMFTRMAAASNHWAILDRQTAFRLKSRYSMLLFQHVSSLVNLDHVTSKAFTVPELRAVLGVEPGKLERFANLNKWAIKPAIEEISMESRFVLTATPRKSGRTVTSITIEWSEKPSEARKALKAEMDRHSAGRKARRNGSAETVARSFPASGSIEFDTHWRDLKRAAGCNMDNTMIADKFRAWCAGKGLPLDARNIEQAFSSFCAKVGRL